MGRGTFPIGYRPLGKNNMFRSFEDFIRTLVALLIIFGITIFFIFLAGGLILLVSELLPKSECSAIPDSSKFDCHPEAGVTADRCQKRGCCFQVSTEPNVPSCFFPENYDGYELTEIREESNEIRAVLHRKIPSGFPGDVQKLNLRVEIIDDYSLRVKVTDATAQRFEVPIPINATPKPLEQMIYDVSLTKNGIFSISRKSTSKVLFVTDFSQMIYADQFLQLSVNLPSPYIYGLGQYYGSFLRNVNWTRITLFNSDRDPRPNNPSYGSQPFYLSLEEDGNAHGMFLLNSNAMDVILQPKPAVTFRPVGGILDFFILLGPSPANVVQQFTGIVGRTFMPPYWSLGFHLCRWGYKSVNQTRETLQRNLAEGIPVQVQWHDIDYMDKLKDFTYDKLNFAELPEFIEELHKGNRNYVVMTDPALSASEPEGTYPPYEEGLKQDVYIKNPNGSVFKAKVWTGGEAVFPDFSHPNAEVFWSKQISDFHSKIKFDGLWLDMNEPSNFIDGGINGCINSSYEDPPYVPNGNFPLRHKTVCMTAKHNQTIHYNEHNLYSYREVAIANKALRATKNKRPFIISRATFLGQGSHGGHWSGDIASTWEDMRYSISSMLSFNLFGISMTGSDICGFVENATAELCARWHSLGAFYPFSRNHNDRDATDQDPAFFGGDVVTAAKNSLIFRYQVLPYLNTLFYKSHVSGDTVARPLFFEFPQDVNTYAIEEQFLWGPALMILPVLYPGARSVEAYFPNATWYLLTHNGLKKVSGGRETLPSGVSEIQLAVRGGHIIPFQMAEETTTESRERNFMLVASLDENQKAYGELYWDDGDSLDSYENEKYNLIKFTVKDKMLLSEVLKNGYPTNMPLGMVLLNELLSQPTEVKVNDEECSIERVFNIDIWKSSNTFDLILQNKSKCEVWVTEKALLVLFYKSMLSPVKIVWN